MSRPAQIAAATRIIRARWRWLAWGAALIAAAITMALEIWQRSANACGTATVQANPVTPPLLTIARPADAVHSPQLRFDDVALARALAENNEPAIENELRRRLSHGFSVALASLQSLTGTDRTRTGDLCCRLVRQLARDHPDRACEALLAEYGATLPPAIVDACYAVLAELQPPRDLAAKIRALPPGEEQRGAARQLAHRWARHEPEAALAWARDRRELLDDAGIRALVESAAHAAPQAALDFVLQQAGTFAQPLRWEMLLSDAETNPATAANALYLLAWAADQPLGTTAWTHLVQQLFARVRDADPARALRFAMAVDEPSLRHALLAANARANWVTDYGQRHGALALAALFEDPRHQITAVAHCVETAATRGADANAIASLVTGLPPGALRNAAINAALPALAQRQPAAAAALIGKFSGSAEERAELVADARAVCERFAPAHAPHVRHFPD